MQRHHRLGASGIAALAAGTWLSAGPARAAEGAVYGGPVGGTDIRNAYVAARPGLYLGIADVPGWAFETDGNDGAPSRTAQRFNLVYNIDAAALVYVSKWHLLGGSLSAAVQGSYYPYARFSVNDRTQRIAGWGDTYVDFLKWTYYAGHSARPRPGSPALPYGLSVQAAYSMILPTGAYNTHQFTTPGHNDFFVIPNVAATWLTPTPAFGDGLELDGRLFLNHALRNASTRYSSGDIVDLDYAVSERFGLWQAGLAGTLATQVAADRVDDVAVSPAGRYFGQARLGLVVARDIPSLAMSLKFKSSTTFWARNTIRGTQIVLALGMRL